MMSEKADGKPRCFPFCLQFFMRYHGNGVMVCKHRKSKSKEELSFRLH